MEKYKKLCDSLILKNKIDHKNEIIGCSIDVRISKTVEECNGAAKNGTVSSKTDSPK